MPTACPASCTRVSRSAASEWPPSGGSPAPQTVFLNDGSGVFTDSGQRIGGGISAGVALGDLDGDGDLDAVVANAYGYANRVWQNNGSGVFTEIQSEQRIDHMVINDIHNLR